MCLTTPPTRLRSSDGTSCQLSGKLLNFNTIESFKQSDKQALFRQHADKVSQRASLRLSARAAFPTRARLTLINSPTRSCGLSSRTRSSTSLLQTSMPPSLSPLRTSRSTRSSTGSPSPPSPQSRHGNCSHPGRLCPTHTRMTRCVHDALVLDSACCRQCLRLRPLRLIHLRNR